MAGAVSGGQLDSRFARLLNKYNTLGPELLEILPKETTSGLSLVDSVGALDGFGTTIESYKDIDFNALKAAGYTELAEDMEIAANLGLVAGEMGLEALKVIKYKLFTTMARDLMLAFAMTGGTEAKLPGCQDPW